MGIIQQLSLVTPLQVILGMLLALGQKQYPLRRYGEEWDKTFFIELMDFLICLKIYATPII